MKSPGILRNIPSVTELLESPPLKGLVKRVSHMVVVGEVRSFLDNIRTELQEKASGFDMPPVSELAERIANQIRKTAKPGLQEVVNATGILLHTGLGRAPLAEQAIAQISATARGYCNLEIDLDSGQRSERSGKVEGLLKDLTGAEAGLVVNNNAAATLLTLTALAAGKEVLVSRGQLVEIGGSYRLPEVMAASGAMLREVGTTNKTYAYDYEDACGENTAALLRVHPSNFQVVGFTGSVSLSELVQLGRAQGLPVIDDIGSGSIIRFERDGLFGEPLAKESLAAGADLVLFSGDKLLGGPQCGIILGRRSFVQKIRKHPMARAVRIGKMTLAALSATLQLYRDPRTAAQTIPLVQLLETSPENLKNRAERLASQLAASEAVAQAIVVQDVAYLGGGSLPAQKLPTWCVALKPTTSNVTTMAKDLRTGTPPVIGRVHEDMVLLDLRSVFPRQDQELVAAAHRLAEKPSG